MKNSMYDVVIVGAGPAGGQAARELAKQGRKILVIERVEHFGQNNFSSGGTPMETLTTFSLPEKVIGTYWDTMSLQYDDNYAEWKDKKDRGAVFNFKELKQFLVDDAKKNGAEVLMHTKVSAVRVMDDGTYELTFADQKSKAVQTVKSKVVIDGTGPARTILSQLSGDSTPSFVVAPGMEYIVKVNEKFTNKKLEKNLLFFMGKKYAPNGYSWIFPMGNGEYKVGIGVDTAKYQQDVGRPMTDYIDLILVDFFGTGNFSVVEKHGGTVKCAMGATETFVNGNVVGVGDTIFTIYPFVGEGIRHALHSGRMAAEEVGRFLDGEVTTLKAYELRMKKYFGFKWRLGSWLITFFGKQGRNGKQELGKVFKRLEHLPFEDMFDLLFHYKFFMYAKILWKFYVG